MKLRAIIFSSAMILVAPAMAPIGAQTVLTSQEASKVLSFEDMNMTASKISGVVTNRSPHTIKDVELMIQYHWLWQDERNPGQNPPGRTAIIELDKPFEPGQSHRFSFTPQPPLPSRNDGHFRPEVDVAAFTTVVRQHASTR
ncbi:MAG: hypothetical protein WD688_22835 [Candidatus Binatia bacterium]